MSPSEILILLQTLVKEDPAIRIIEQFDESEIEMMMERGFTPVSELVLVDTSRNLEVFKSERGWVAMEGWTLELYILLGHSADDLMEAMEQDLWEWDWTPFPGVIFQR